MGRRNTRSAYSLIEAMIATAILVGSTIVLAQLAGIGREHAWKADDVTRAQALCQSKLNELLAGIDSLQPVDNQAFEYDDDGQGMEGCKPGGLGEDFTQPIQLQPASLGKFIERGAQHVRVSPAGPDPFGKHVQAHAAGIGIAAHQCDP